MQDIWTSRLSECLDDELAPAERAALDVHLAECEHCQATLASLRMVVQRARGLEDAAPAHDLWPAVAVTIKHQRQARRISFSLPELAAASLFIALVGGLSALSIVDRGAARDGVADAPIGAAIRTISIEDPASDRAAADLVEVLNANRKNLNPTTVEAVERSLATIDRAIVEAKTALEKDPGNSFLTGHLARERRLKLAVLRQVHNLTEVSQ